MAEVKSEKDLQVQGMETVDGFERVLGQAGD